MDDGGFGPGMGAFAIFLLLAITLWLLMRNMNSRLRRMSYAERDADLGGQRGDGATPADPGAEPSAESGSGDAVEGDGGSGEVSGEGKDR